MVVVILDREYDEDVDDKTNKNGDGLDGGWRVDETNKIGMDGNNNKKKSNEKQQQQQQQQRQLISQLEMLLPIDDDYDVDGEGKE